MSSKVYSRIGKALKKQDLRRDLDEAFQLLENGTDPANAASDLVSVNDKDLPTGATRFVRSYRAFFELDKTSTLGLQSDVVLATRSGTGRWLRMSGTSALWANQTVWHIDPALGNDQADGLTVATSLKTLAEFRRRLGDAIITGTVDVFFESALSEDFNPTAINTTGFGVVNYHGKRTLLASGTMTTVQVYNGATKADGRITDSSKAAAFWTTYVNKLLVDTTSGAYGWVAKDLGAKTCRHSPLWNDTDFYYVDPTVGDSWAVYDLLPVTSTIVASGLGAGVIKDMAISSNITVTGISGNFSAYSCNIAGTISCDSSFSDFYACRHGNSVLSFAGTLYMDAFYMDSSRIRPAGGIISIFTLGLLNGAGAAVQCQEGGTLSLSDKIAFFDITSTPFVSFLGPSRMYITAQAFGTGSGYPLVLQVDGGASIRFISNAVLPNITAGGTSYASVGGTAKLQAALSTSFLNTTNGALIAYPQT